MNWKAYLSFHNNVKICDHILLSFSLEKCIHFQLEFAKNSFCYLINSYSFDVLLSYKIYEISWMHVVIVADSERCLIKFKTFRQLRRIRQTSKFTSEIHVPQCRIKMHFEWRNWKSGSDGVGLTFPSAQENSRDYVRAERIFTLAMQMQTKKRYQRWFQSDKTQLWLNKCWNHTR